MSVFPAVFAIILDGQRENWNGASVILAARDHLILRVDDIGIAGSAGRRWSGRPPAIAPASAKPAAQPPHPNRQDQPGYDTQPHGRRQDDQAEKKRADQRGDRLGAALRRLQTVASLCKVLGSYPVATV